MILSIIMDSFTYISQAPAFWGSMGFTTALGIFIGALLYDGNLNQVMKGVVAVGSHAFMIIWLNLIRINSVLPGLKENGHSNACMALAGTATIVAVSIAWLLGMIIGVSVIRLKYRRTHG